MGSFRFAGCHNFKIDPYIYYFLSQTYLYQGNYAESLRYANICLELDAGFYQALLIRSECYRQMNLISEFLSDSFSVVCYISGINKQYIIEMTQTVLRKNHYSPEKLASLSADNFPNWDYLINSKE